MNESTKDTIARYRYGIRESLYGNIKSLSNKFKAAKKAGFEGVEIESSVSSDDFQRISDASNKSGLIIHSVFTSANWVTPLTGKNQKLVSAGIKATISALEYAKKWGAKSMLFHSGHISPEQSYTEAHDQFREVIKKELLPTAEDLGIVLGLENTDAGFLLSPVEYIQFIEGFKSRCIRPYFDTGNVWAGLPEQWIDVIGNGIVKLHVKDFRKSIRWRKFDWQTPGKGDIHWPAIRKALNAIDFKGWATYAAPDGFFMRGVNFGRNKVDNLFSIAGIPGIGTALDLYDLNTFRRQYHDFRRALY